MPFFFNFKSKIKVKAMPPSFSKFSCLNISELMSIWYSFAPEIVKKMRSNPFSDSLSLLSRTVCSIFFEW